MARRVQNLLDTGCELDADGVTEVLAAGTGLTAAPSGTTGSGTFNTQGVAWAHLNCITAVAAVSITVYVYRAGAWYVADWFKFSGVVSVPLGSFSYNFACLGADYVNVRVTTVTGSTIAVTATLSQEV
jgi:hypothetical protein